MFSDKTRWPKPCGFNYARRAARPPAVRSAVRVAKMHGKDSVSEVRQENATRQLPNPVASPAERKPVAGPHKYTIIFGFHDLVTLKLD